jgi:hypothetical protein
MGVFQRLCHVPLLQNREFWPEYLLNLHEMYVMECDARAAPQNENPEP